MSIRPAAVVSALLGAILAVACAGQQGVRTGTVHYVNVGEASDPGKLQIHVGDEVRWVNAGPTPVTVFFNRGLPALLCHTGFSSSGLRATIAPQESAAMCFGEPGVFTYGVEQENKNLVTSSIRVADDRS